MDADAQRKWSWLTGEQHGVVAKGQVDDAGIGRGSLGHRLKSGKWQRLHRGVYAAFNGELTREAQLWAAVLRAGEGAVLSYESAAELQHLTDGPGPEIHITVPASRRPAQNKPIPGVVIHRSRHVRPQELPEWELPRTRVEDTVLDLVDAAETFGDAYDWIARAVSGQHTTAGLLREAARERKRMRWRKWADDALTDVAEESCLHVESHYRRDVELAHGLPKGARPAGRAGAADKHREEVSYPGHDLRVELDGGIGDPGDRTAEHQRRNAAGRSVGRGAGDVRTLGFGHVDVTERACRIAVLVAAALRDGGWDGTPHACRRPDCAVARH